MDERNLKIISYLRQDGRLSLTKLARTIGVPVSTIFDKTKAQKGFLIERYTALLHYDRLGFSTRANVLLKAVNGDKARLAEHLCKHPNINNLYKINNGWDLMAECVFRTMRELEEFLEKLEANFKIKAKEVHYIIEELKREAFLSDPKLAGLVMPELSGPHNGPC